MIQIFAWLASFTLYWYMYPVVQTFLEDHSSLYRNLKSHQIYVVSNLMKATALMWFVLLFHTTIYNVLFHGEWNPRVLQFMAPLYVNLDLVSLLRVERMANSTKAHHILVVIFGLFVSFFSPDPGTFTGHICVYAVYSSLAYFVNAFLSIRFIISQYYRWHLWVASKVSAILYTLICAVHWNYHLTALYNNPWQFWFLLPMFYVFVHDDLVLINFLRNYAIDQY